MSVDKGSRPEIPVGEPGWDPARLALVDPLRYADLLAGFRLLLQCATDVGDAIARAEGGQEPDGNLLDLDDPKIAAAYRQAFEDIKAERTRREKSDLNAAALLTITRVYHDPWDVTNVNHS